MTFSFANERPCREGGKSSPQTALQRFGPREQRWSGYDPQGLARWPAAANSRRRHMLLLQHCGAVLFARLIVIIHRFPAPHIFARFTRSGHGSRCTKYTAMFLHQAVTQNSRRKNRASPCVGPKGRECKIQTQNRAKETQSSAFTQGTIFVTISTNLLHCRHKYVIINNFTRDFGKKGGTSQAAGIPALETNIIE